MRAGPPLKRPPQSAFAGGWAALAGAGLPGLLRLSFGIGYYLEVAPVRRVHRRALIGIAAAVFALTGAGAVALFRTAPQQRATTTAAVPAAAAPVGAATSVRDGTYEVGKDISAGRYKTAGPPTKATIRNCRWQSAKDDSGELRSIISSGDTQGPGSVTVKAGEFFQTSGGCTWTKQ